MVTKNTEGVDEQLLCQCVSQFSPSNCGCDAFKITFYFYIHNTSSLEQGSSFLTLELVFVTK